MADAAATGEPAPGHPEIERLVAPNPGPMTLEGTNTYVLATADGALVIDPGPAHEGHARAVLAAAEARGGLAGVLLTHSHLDHSGAVALLGDAPLLWGRPGTGDESSGTEPVADPAPRPPERIGPLAVVPTPGHATDHVCYLLGDVLFSGDLVLGRGSSFVPPDGGSLAAYVESLHAVRALRPALLCPGHGPWVQAADAKLAEYVEHRLDRERRLLAALADGERETEALLDRAWSDVPAELRPAAALVLEAHLQKLDAEGRLPEGVRPRAPRSA